MDNFFGMEPTGRRVRAPVYELVELGAPSEEDVAHTALVFDAGLRGSAILRSGVELALNFMQYPLVQGLAELTHHDLDAGTFVYRTGTTRSVSEIIRAYRDIGQTAGVRAAMELCYLAGMALGEAGESGPTQGVFNHGSLDPHNMLVQEDGQIMLIAHGIPQVEIWHWRQDNSSPVREDSFRYCPPERIDGALEDPTSDLYSLSLIAYEMITGKELFTGTLDRVMEAAKLAQGPQLVQKNKDLPKPVRELFEQALQFDPNLRLQPNDFVMALYHVLTGDGLSGDPLSEAVKRVAGAGRKGRALVAADETTAIPKRALQRAVGVRGTPSWGPGARGPAVPAPGDAPPETRWGSVSRGPRRGGEEEGGDDDALRRRRRLGDEPAETDDRRRRRRLGEEEEAEQPVRRTRRLGDEAEPEAPARRLTRGDDAPSEEPRRTRRLGDDAEAPSGDAPRRTVRGEEAPSGDAPRRTVRGEEAPSGDAPRRTVRGEEAPSGDAPRRTVRGEEPPAGDTPRRTVRGEEAPAGDAPRRTVRGEEAPAGDAPRRTVRGEEPPAGDAPRRTVRGEEPPAGDAPRRTVRGEEPPAADAPRRTVRGEEPPAGDAPRRTVRGEEPPAGGERRMTRGDAPPSGDAPRRTVRGEEPPSDRPRRLPRGEE